MKPDGKYILSIKLICFFYCGNYFSKLRISSGHSSDFFNLTPKNKLVVLIEDPSRAKLIVATNLICRIILSQWFKRPKITTPP